MTDREANGNCFEVAASIALKFRFSDDPDGVNQGLSYLDQLHGTNVHVAHGMVRHPYEPFMHPHGWIEFEIDGCTWSPMCLDCANGNRVVMIRELYYRLGHIDPDTVRRYNPEQVRDKLLEQEQYGPWDISKDIQEITDGR